MNHIIDLSVVCENFFNYWIIYDIRYNKILLGYVSATLHLKQFKIFRLFFQINVFIKFPFDLYWFPKAIRIIPFVSFFYWFFPTPIIISFIFLLSRQHFFNATLLNLIFTFYKIFFHLIQLKPLDIYPFHQNSSIICYRLALPFPFPLPLNW